MLDLSTHIRPGDGVWWSQAAAEATPLVDGLLDQVGRIGPVRGFCGLTFNRRLRELPPELTMTSYGAMGELRRTPRLDVIPAHYSALPRLFAERLLPGDVGLVQVSPSGPDGRCSLTDGVLRLVDKGVVTGRRKEIDTGLVVTGAAIGSAELYARIGEIPVEFRAASYTHSAAVLARLGRLVSINAALQVDLTGQVGAETARGRYLGGIGGQADFSGAAARTGARSIIALRSCAGDASTIVAALDGAVATTARADVDVVVTEHGVAHLRGCPLSQRAERLTAIAAPQHRDQLSKGLG